MQPNKNRISWFLAPYEISFFIPVLAHLPKDILDIFILDESENIYNLDISCYWFYKRYKYYKFEKEYNIKVANNNDLLNSSFAVTSSHIFDYGKWVDKTILDKTPTLYLLHDLIATGYAPLSCRWMIAQHENMALSNDKDKIDYTNKNFNEYKIKFKNSLTEYAYSGLFHIGGWNKKICNTTRDEKICNLEKCIGESISREKPVVAFFRDEFTQDDSIIDMLKEISKKVTIIYKSLGWENDPVYKKLKDSIFVWKNDNLAPNELRFFSDIIMAGCASGTIVSSLMLGLNVLSYHSKMIKVGSDLVKYEKLFEGKIARLINKYIFSVDVDDTDRVLYNLLSPVYWEKFSANLSTLQKDIFGNYMVDGADIYTASLILRAFNKGSFGDATVAIRLRSESKMF